MFEDDCRGEDWREDPDSQLEPELAELPEHLGSTARAPRPRVIRRARRPAESAPAGVDDAPTTTPEPRPC
jgi:hypothetical protein